MRLLPLACAKFRRYVLDCLPQCSADWGACTRWQAQHLLVAYLYDGIALGARHAGASLRRWSLGDNGGNAAARV